MWKGARRAHRERRSRGPVRCKKTEGVSWRAALLLRGIARLDTHRSVEVAVKRSGAPVCLLERLRDACGLGETAWNGRHSVIVAKSKKRQATPRSVVPLSDMKYGLK